MRRIPRVRVQPGQKFLGAKIDQWTKFPRRQNTSFECRNHQNEEMGDKS